MLRIGSDGMQRFIIHLFVSLQLHRSAKEFGLHA